MEKATDTAESAEAGLVYLVHQNDGGLPATGLVLLPGGEIALFHKGQGMACKLTSERMKGLAYALLGEAARIDGDKTAPLWTSTVAGTA